MYPQLFSFVDSSKTICDSLGFGVRPGLGLIEIDMQYLQCRLRNLKLSLCQLPQPIAT